MKQSHLRIAVVLLALGVALGAFGAHGLESRIPEKALKAWNTGVSYHFIHSLGLIALTLLFHADLIQEKWYQRSWGFMIAGIMCFSGSLYFLTTQSILGLDMNWLGPVTPIGGLMFVTAWILAGVGFKRA